MIDMLVWNRAASTTQKDLAVTSVALDILVTQAKVALTTASPAPARTTRRHGGKDHTHTNTSIYTHLQGNEWIQQFYFLNAEFIQMFKVALSLCSM